MSLSSNEEWEINFRVYSKKELEDTRNSLESDLEKSPHDNNAIMLLHLVEKEMKSRGFLKT